MISLRRGCPIRISTDQSLLAAPHGFSQRATSFIASWCQGIHRMPFCRSIFQFSPQTGMIEPTRSVTHHAQEPFIRFLCSNPQHQPPLGTTINPDSTQKQNNPMMYDCAGRSFIMLLNTRNSCNLWQQAHTHQPWSDNPIAKTRTNFSVTTHAATPKPVRASRRTKTYSP